VPGLASVLQQDLDRGCEVLLVDDFSTDPATLEAIRELAASDSRVVALRTPRNGGPAVARNLGLDHATRPWIGFLDADDLWMPDRLARTEAALCRSPHAGWIGGDTLVLGASGTFASAQPLRCTQDENGPVAVCATPALTQAIILDGMHLGTNMIRRDRLGRLRFDPAARYGEDILFLVLLSLSVAMVHAPGAAYVSRRQHESMMWSAGRLSARFASGPRAGFGDPRLRGFRREYRWALYAVYKDLAVNNLINRRGWAGLGHALRALALDPREIWPFLRYVGLFATQGRPDLARRARRYNGCEQVVLDEAGRFQDTR
jgi:glycosyltransferase involved in cell wall biosynthesis